MFKENCQSDSAVLKVITVTEEAGVWTSAITKETVLWNGQGLDPGGLICQVKLTC